MYSGGASGARNVLGIIAAATIGVAGTTFSITVAALTLASNQMGPRLLRNFTQIGPFVSRCSHYRELLPTADAGVWGSTNAPQAVLDT
ncbi:DUF2254 domain-containing protein [Belnapia sp. T18]|uniref:DUF2254 domain-containing protein n=1 Tax=Belnapia arida TaxID=2804533 RepID=A0ABS1UA64_9PROT|nr:DUF2254 domain-containing protein [Belnapia arida]